MADYKRTEGGIFAAADFVAAATHCGIKSEGLDLVLIHSLRPAAAAATITTNQFRAAPTYVTEKVVADGNAQTIIANSGNANCATGAQGLRDAWQMAEEAGRATGVEGTEVIVCSTGRIGVPLPMHRIVPAIATLGGMLNRDDPDIIARAIMTTDTHPKSCAVEFDVGGATCHIGGIAKGAGMICPNMATMLCLLCCDVAIDAALLRETLRWCVERSFNCITVDGDMSTNDTCAVLANGAAGNATLVYPEDAGYDNFRAALLHVTQDLARQIAFDGEGATKRVSIRVIGAESFEEARLVGRTVANYTLFRTMVYGMDFNWGRIAAAIGCAPVAIDPGKVSIEIQGLPAWHRGEPVPFDLSTALDSLRVQDIEVKISLGDGTQEATVWTCDLSPRYVELNAEYEVGGNKSG